MKVGNKNKKRTRNFSEKEDILLASAWLEVSMDAVQSIDQTRSSYWQRIHECYHKHKTFESDRNISYLSHTVGVSFKEVLVSFVHGTVKCFVLIKAVSPSKTRFNKHVCCTRMQIRIRGHLICCIVGTCCSMPRSGTTSLVTTPTKNRRQHQ